MRASRKRRSGGATVELAFVLPIFLAIILCQIESSRIGMVSQLLTNAAREGARVAVIHGKTPTDVNQRIAQVLQGTGVSLGSLSAVSTDPGTPGAYIMPTNWNTAGTNTPVTVVLRVRFSSVSWNPNTNGTNPPPSAQVASILPMPNYKAIQLSGQATMNSERP